MVTTVHKSNTVAFPTKKKSTRNGSGINHNDYIQLRLNLSNLLQTSLEIPQLLQLFFDEVKNSLPIDSMLYSNHKLDQPILLGATERHSCQYNLITNNEALGELTFTRSKRFTETELQLLELLISGLVCPIKNALLYQSAVLIAQQDPLTGTGNRRALERSLSREINLAQRHQHPLSILALDIDNFKHVNDSFGHAAGDSVLKAVSSQLKNCCRDTDEKYHAYRFGGEEFVILLSNTNTQGAAVVAERIRQQIEATQTAHNDHTINVTASIGIAGLQNKDNMASLFSRADQALYQAKDKGRNQVVTAQ